MTIKLWWPRKGEFVKEIEMPEEYEQRQTFTLIRYVGSTGNPKQVKQVFINVGNNNYEYNHEVEM